MKDTNKERDRNGVRNKREKETRMRDMSRGRKGEMEKIERQGKGKIE